jgi:hypothetical protein
MKRVAGAFVVLATLMFASQAQAQWAVFDATNYANAVREYRELQQMYTTANQTRDQIIQAYNLARQMAQMPQNLRQRYAATFTNWKTLSAPNTFGNTSSWISAANTGDPGLASVGYRLAGITLTTPSSLGNQDARSQEITKAQYASAELADGVTVNEITTLGEIRARSEALNRQITNLEQDSYSTASTQQTEMAVLGKINSANVMQLRSQQDTNQILAALALYQLLASKDQFDQQKRALNQEIYFQQNFPDSMNRLTSGMTRSMDSISFSTR